MKGLVSGSLNPGSFQNLANITCDKLKCHIAKYNYYQESVKGEIALLTPLDPNRCWFMLSPQIGSWVLPHCHHSWAHFNIYSKKLFSFYSWIVVFKLFAFLGKKILTQVWDSLAPVFFPSFNELARLGQISMLNLIFWILNSSTLFHADHQLNLYILK